MTLNGSGSGAVNVSGARSTGSGLAQMVFSGRTHTWMRLPLSGTGIAVSCLGSRRPLSLSLLRRWGAGFSG